MSKYIAAGDKTNAKEAVIMASVKKVTEMLYRIKNGESMTTTEWDTKVVPQTVRSILKKYDLVKTYNEKVPVNQDAELADRFFQAGLELAETVGIHCTDSETVVKFSRKEILDAVKEAPSEIKFGCGTDQVTIKSRGVSDPVKPLYCASLSIQIDEDIYPTLVEGLEGFSKITSELTAVQKAYIEEGAVQCGFCTPGFIIGTEAMIRAKKMYNDEDIKRELSGHFCRCTGYERIFSAVKRCMQEANCYKYD